MPKNKRQKDFVMLMILYLQFLSCLNIIKGFCILILMYIMEMELKKLFI